MLEHKSFFLENYKTSLNLEQHFNLLFFFSFHEVYYGDEDP